MPAFDPVRDAVANSPRTSTYPLPSPSPLTGSLLFTTPTSTPINAFPFPPNPPASPLAEVRSHHSLAQSGRPPAKRLSSISMLLNGPDDPPAKVKRLGSLMSPVVSEPPLLPEKERRPSTASTGSTSPPKSLRPGTAESDSAPNVAARIPFTFTSSPTNSPSPSRSNQPKLEPSQPSMSFTKPRLPYNPQRVTPPVSILRPLTETEASRWVSQNPLRKFERPGKALKSEVKSEEPSPLGKRTRDSRENGAAEAEPPNKRSKDVRLVVNHYNARPDVGVDKRQDSPIIGLKSFNNWIKSVLISRFAVAAFQQSPRAPGGVRGKVLDLGCGKGGDLQKWSKARIAEYVGLDIAALSVDQAFRRWQDMRAGRRNNFFDGEFKALDCFLTPLSEGLPARRLQHPFDAVSMQFCMHYAFESEAKARMMLDNVSKYLRDGGVFIGTIPNDQQLMEKLDELPEDALDLAWGNNIYTVRFDNKIKSTYGQRYSFYLKDAVDDVPEYVVHWANFESLAATYGLRLLYKKEFHDVFDEHREHAEFGPLLERMRVVDSDGESHLDEDQWDAANVYLAFAFEKVSSN